MRDSLFDMAASAQAELANVLDSSSDSLVIAKKDSVHYLNNEAWRFLACKGNRDDFDDYSQVMCVDKSSGEEVPLIEQLKNYLLILD